MGVASMPWDEAYGDLPSGARGELQVRTVKHFNGEGRKIFQGNRRQEGCLSGVRRKWILYLNRISARIDSIFQLCAYFTLAGVDLDTVFLPCIGAAADGVETYGQVAESGIINRLRDGICDHLHVGVQGVGRYLDVVSMEVAEDFKVHGVG